MRNLLFLIFIIFTSCIQEVDKEQLKSSSLKGIPYAADTTILISGGILDVAISYKKGNSKIKKQSNFSIKKDTVFIENLSLFNVFNIQLANSEKQYLLEQAFKSSLFLYAKGSEMPIELKNWKNYYSDYKLNLMNTKMRNVEPYQDTERHQFVAYSAVELRQGIEKNKKQFSDKVNINAINDMNTEIYPVITETYFKMTSENKIFYIVFKSEKGC